MIELTNGNEKKKIKLKGERYPKAKLITSNIEQIPSASGDIFLSLGILKDNDTYYIVILDLKRATIHVEELYTQYNKTKVSGMLKQVDDQEEWEAIVNSVFAYNLITVERITFLMEKFSDIVPKAALQSLEELKQLIKLKKQALGK